MIDAIAMFVMFGVGITIGIGVGFAIGYLYRGQRNVEKVGDMIDEFQQ